MRITHTHSLFLIVKLSLVPLPRSLQPLPFLLFCVLQGKQGVLLCSTDSIGNVREDMWAVREDQRASQIERPTSDPRSTPERPNKQPMSWRGGIGRAKEHNKGTQKLAHSCMLCAGTCKSTVLHSARCTPMYACVYTCVYACVCMRVCMCVRAQRQRSFWSSHVLTLLSLRSSSTTKMARSVPCAVLWPQTHTHTCVCRAKWGGESKVWVEKQARKERSGCQKNWPRRWKALT